MRLIDVSSIDGKIVLEFVRGPNALEAEFKHLSVRLTLGMWDAVDTGDVKYNRSAVCHNAIEVQLNVENSLDSYMVESVCVIVHIV